MFTTVLLIATLQLPAAGLAQEPPPAPPAPQPQVRGIRVRFPSEQERSLSEEDRRLLAEADELFRDQEWAKASRVYQSLTQRNPRLGIAWFRLGYCWHVQGKLEEAITAHEKAAEHAELRHLKAAAYYNLGCAHALRAKPDQALDYLEKAVAAGFRQKEMLRSDPDLQSLLMEPRFKALIEQVDLATIQRNIRQLDFWEGEWNVLDGTTAVGQEAPRLGASSVRKVENGHLLVETWRGTGGYTATNFFYFDPSTGKWRLTWVNGSGELTRAEGEFVGEVLILRGEHVNPTDGKVSKFKGKLAPLPDGRAQLTLSLSADGKEWRSYFNGIYVRSTAPAK